MNRTKFRIRLVALALTAASALGVPLASQGAPIDYSFEGMASGRIVGVGEFNDAAFTITVHSDTEDITVLPGTRTESVFGRADFSIAGSGADDFLLPLEVRRELGTRELQLTDGRMSLFALTVLEDGFDRYRLRQYTSRVLGILEDAFSFSAKTSLGGLDMILPGRARVFFSAVTPIPEPETYAMLLAGLALLGTWGRRRAVAVRRAD